MTTLKVLNLIDSAGRPSEDLEDLVHGEGEHRRSTLRHVLERFYVPVFELDLENATRGQFHDAFRKFGTKEGVLTKCEGFFIRAAQAAGIELSKRIVARRHGTSRSRNAPAQARPKAPVSPVPGTEKPATQSPVEIVTPAGSMMLELADRILAKYPDFDPEWDPVVQAKWLEGMTRLSDGLSVRSLERDVTPEDGAAEA